MPHTKVGCTLTMLADPDCVRIVDGAGIVARHHRSYDKGTQVEDAAHLDALVARRAQQKGEPTDVVVVDDESDSG